MVVALFASGPDVNDLPTDQGELLEELFGLKVVDCEVQGKSPVGYHMYLLEWLSKFRRKADCNRELSARLDAEFLSHRSYSSGDYREFTDLWLDLNKPEFKASYLKTELKLTRAIICRNFAGVLSSLSHSACYTTGKLASSLQPIDLDSAF